MELEEMDVPRSKKKKRTALNTWYNIKVYTKWVIDLHVKHKTITFLEENIKENLCDLEWGTKKQEQKQNP